MNDIDFNTHNNDINNITSLPSLHWVAVRNGQPSGSANIDARSKT